MLPEYYTRPSSAGLTWIIEAIEKLRNPSRRAPAATATMIPAGGPPEGVVPLFFARSVYFGIAPQAFSFLVPLPGRTRNGTSPATRRAPGRRSCVHPSARSSKRPIFFTLQIASVILCLLCIAGLQLQGQTTAEKADGHSAAGPIFINVSRNWGVNFKHESKHSSQKYLPETMGAGVAAFDYDNDGLLDLFFVNAAELEDPMPAEAVPDKSQPSYWNRLYRNNGKGSFRDVTEAAGLAGHSYGMGVAVGDYDNDGDSDLYVTNFGSNILYRNDGDGTFSDVTKDAGVSGGGWSASAVFVDYDHDGLLDLIVARYLEWDFSTNRWCGERGYYRSYCHPKHFEPATYLVYHNKGSGVFEDVSEASGFAKHPGKGLGIAINDFDHDGRIDIAVANDSFPQQLFRNSGDGTFDEVGLLAGVAYDEDGNTFAGMGLDFTDYDNDGWPDLFINALANERYALYRNKEGSFEYVTGPSHVGVITAVHSGWGTAFLDYDNDGWKDLFVAQGHVMDNIELTQPSLRYREPFLLMKNLRGKFQDVSEQSGDPFLVPRPGRGAVAADLDNDGFLDLVVNCNNEPSVILRNEGVPSRHWLVVNTVGTVSNRDGIGAQVRIISESGLEQHETVSTAGSYLSSGDKRVHFGLGGEKNVRLLEVRWPSGIVQRIENVAADQILTVQEPEDAVEQDP